MTRKTSYLIFLMITLATTKNVELLAQLPTTDSAERSCQFSEMFRPEGWDIPGRSGAVPEGRRLSLENSPEVFVTNMKPGKVGSRLLLADCSKDLPGRLVITAKPVRVLEMSKVDYKGRAFAYVARYEPQFLANGVPYRTLAYLQVVFIDIEGNGSFSVMRYDTRGLFLASPDVPEWAKAGGPQIER